jgi:hypothetical protein
MNSGQKDRTRRLINKAQRAYAERNSSPTADLRKPQLVGVEDDGFIESAKLNVPLEVLVDEWDNKRDGDELILYWRRQAGGGQVELASRNFPDMSGVTFPIALEIPVDELNKTDVFFVNYDVFNPQTGASPSLDSNLVLDVTPPYGRFNPTAPVLTDELITDEFLASEGAVKCTFPLYPIDYKPGDKIGWAWLKDIPSNPEDFHPVGGGEIDIANPVFNIPASLVTGAGDGVFHAVYVLQDRAGNVSKLSYYKDSVVLVGPLPANLKPPTVPKADDDGFVGRMDAFEGVAVHIERYDDWKTDDEIVVTWGTRTLLPYRPASWPVDIHVPWPVMRDEYAAATGEVPTVVKYHVLRQKVVFPSPPAAEPAVSIMVDFSVVGPTPDPETDPPNPINPKLGTITVRGAVSADDNILTPEDFNADASGTFNLYLEAQPEHNVIVNWAGVDIDPPYEVGTNSPGDPWPLTIPWAAVEAGSNGTKEVYYSIGQPGTNNRQYSRITTVEVSAIVAQLPMPDYPNKVYIDFPGLTPYYTIRCGDLTPDNELLVRIPPDDRYFIDGTVMHLEYTAVRGRYEDGVNAPITGVDYTETVRWSRTDAVNGKNWRIPYDPYLSGTYLGDGLDNFSRARVSYTVEGLAEESPVGEVVLAMFLPGGTCNIP